MSEGKDPCIVVMGLLVLFMFVFPLLFTVMDMVAGMELLP